VALEGFGDVLPEDVSVEREVAGDWVVQSEGAFVTALDPTLTDELRSEGLARELVSRVQRMRKEAGYEVSDRIALWIDGADAVRAAARAHAAWIGEETLARKLAIAERSAGADLEQRHDLDGHEAVIALRRG
jgi:isoleucyl-tRNA synthetase